MIRTSLLSLLACTVVTTGAAAQATDSLPRSEIPTVGGDSAPRAPRPRRSSRSVITRDDILEARVASAYEVVQRLRPAWLRLRGPSSPNETPDVIVYVDGMRRGYTETLREVNAAEVAEVRFVEPVAAGARFGRGHTRGVIVVTSQS